MKTQATNTSCNMRNLAAFWRVDVAPALVDMARATVAFLLFLFGFAGLVSTLLICFPPGLDSAWLLVCYGISGLFWSVVAVLLLRAACRRGAEINQRETDSKSGKLCS